MNPTPLSQQDSPVISSALIHVVAHLSGEKEGAQSLVVRKNNRIKDEVITRDQVGKKVDTKIIK